MSRSRIADKFAALKAEGRAAFVPYIMGGDPDLATAQAILNGLPAAGADIIELGFPFSDPMAEGPPIQRAALRALDKGMKLTAVLGMVHAFRQTDQTTPVILMGYTNPIVSWGYAKFAADAAEAGIDGMIVVDLPPEEEGPLADALDENDMALIRLTTPTTDAARLKTVARRTSGFLYYVSVAGVTGVLEANAEAVAPAVVRVRAATGLPVAVGFGIKTPERAAAIARVADAVVVGSALCDAVAAALDAKQDPAAKVLELAGALAQAVRGARTAVAGAL